MSYVVYYNGRATKLRLVSGLVPFLDSILFLAPTIIPRYRRATTTPPEVSPVRVDHTTPGAITYRFGSDSEHRARANHHVVAEPTIGKSPLKSGRHKEASDSKELGTIPQFMSARSNTLSHGMRKEFTSSTKTKHRKGRDLSVTELKEIDFKSTEAYDLIALYSYFCESSKLDSSLQLIRECIQAKRLDVLSKLQHQRFLRPAADLRAVKQAMRFVQLMPRAFVDARTYNMVLSVCAQAADLRAALQVKDMLQAAGLKPDTILYTNLIKVCAAAGEAERAFTVADEMKAAGLNWDKQVYATLVSACTAAISRLTSQSDRRKQLVLLERACDIVDEMVRSPVPTDAAAWNALVTAAGRAGQLQRAFAVLEDMFARGCRPNERTYASLVDACARCGDKELALRVLKKAQREGSASTLPVYSSAIQACLRAPTGSDLDSAMGVYNQMQLAGVDPDAAIYGSLILAAGRAGEIDLALQLQDEMLQDDIPVNTGIDSAMITVYIVNDRLADAVSVYQRARARGEWPVLDAMNALVGAYGRAHRLGDVVNLVADMMLDGGLKPDQYTFHSILTACFCAQESVLALDVYHMMKLRKVALDEATAFLLLLICYQNIRSAPKAASRRKVSTYQLGGDRELERHRLLAALAPRGRTLDLPSQRGEFHWLAQAFTAYRDAAGNGVKPTTRMLNIMLMCLRLPWEGVDGKEREALYESLTGPTGLPPPQLRPCAFPNLGRIGIESVFHVQAITIVEEAIVSGMLPGFDVGSPVDLRSYEPAIAEAYVITVIAAMQRAVEAKRALHKPVTFLVPAFDGSKVFIPSHVNWKGHQKGNGTFRDGKHASTEAEDDHYDEFEDDDEEFDDDDDVFASASEEAMADEKTGLGVAGVLRRLQLWAKENGEQGIIVIEQKEAVRWCKLVQRMVERRSASALPIQKPYGQVAPQGLLAQQRTIRMIGL